MHKHSQIIYWHTFPVISFLNLQNNITFPLPIYQYRMA